MISQKCPRCRSKKVRLGYKPTPIWSRLIARYNLLCDNCNWEFAGFAVPGTTSGKKKRNTVKNSEEFAGNEKESVSPLIEKEKPASRKSSGAAARY